MKLLFILLPSILLMFSGCKEQDSTNKKFTFMQAEFNYAKKDSYYTSKSMFKVNEETGEVWRMSFKDKKWVWLKIEHVD